jgi:hypothetical protein
VVRSILVCFLWPFSRAERTAVWPNLPDLADRARAPKRQTSRRLRVQVFLVNPSGKGANFRGMDEFRARRVVDALRDRGINAHLARGGVGQFGVRVSLPGGREAEWDTDGTAGLEAQVMRDGMLVGYVPQIEGSEDFDEAQVIDAIARTDYDQPIARQRTHLPPRR